jgi:hypothetical protein
LSSSEKLAELAPIVATITAIVEADTTPAVSLKVTLTSPAAMVTIDGMVSLAELEFTPIAISTYVEGAEVNVTVHVAEAGGTSVDGLHARPEM